MANGDRTELLEKAIELGQRAGKWGLVGLGLLVLQSVAVFLSRPSWDSAGGVFGTVGWTLVLAGILANTKRANDMQATTAAEAKIDRAVISQSLPGPSIPPTSADPAVQRVIDKQLATTASGSSARPPNV